MPCTLQEILNLSSLFTSYSARESEFHQNKPENVTEKKKRHSSGGESFVFWSLSILFVFSCWQQRLRLTFQSHFQPQTLDLKNKWNFIWQRGFFIHDFVFFSKQKSDFRSVSRPNVSPTRTLFAAQETHSPLSTLACLTLTPPLSHSLPHLN